MEGQIILLPLRGYGSLGCSGGQVVPLKYPRGNVFDKQLEGGRVPFANLFQVRGFTRHSRLIFYLWVHCTPFDVVWGVLYLGGVTLQIAT